MTEPIARKGEQITCTNGHVICEIVEDLYAWKPIPWGFAIGNWREGQERPAPGSMHKPKCSLCGADFIRPDSWDFHFARNGWRTTP